MTTLETVPSVVGEEPMTEERLVALGRERGYVTVDEILAAFPEAENDVDRLDEILAMLMEYGVELGEEPLAESDEDQDEENDELETGIKATIEADDTVGLYFKETG